MQSWSSVNRFLLGATLALTVVQPGYAQETQITNIQINADNDGLEAVLQASPGSLQNIQTLQNGRTLIFEIPNARLNLESRDTFQQRNPIAGIRSITLFSLEGNRVHLMIVGEDELPSGTVEITPQGAIFRINQRVAAVEAPETPESTTPEIETTETPEEINNAETTEMAEDDDEIEIIVTASRVEERTNNVSRSVTVITREQLETQRRLTPDLGTTLGKLVPGLAPSTQSASNFGQSLRGRSVLVLIDGVPQSTSRNVFRDFRTIDTGAIERIEVIRGASAIYGDGATGGVINIITRRPTEESLTVSTEIGVTSSLTNFAESVGYSFQQSVSGNEGNIDYVISAAFSGTGGFFDANGNRIPPDPNGQGGISDADSISILGKVGFDLSADQRLQVSFNHLRDRQNTEYTTDPSVDFITELTPARAIRGLSLDESQGTDNTQFNVQYRHDDVLGSQLQTQLYYRNYLTRFFPFDARGFSAFGDAIIQSRVESEKVGGRLQLDTPLSSEGTARLIWGADYFYEDTVQPVSLFNEGAFDASGGLVYRKQGDRIWTPPLGLSSLGLFAQLNLNVSDQWIVNGGLRHERAGINVNNFTTLAGNTIQGGELTYQDTLFNAGIVFLPTPEISLFANFSQGFSLADVGRVLRSAPAGLSVRQLNPEPQKVNSYELGIRGQWNNIQASLAGFYNESNLGTTFDAALNVIRAPERVYGVEATVDSRLSDRWRVGSTLSWSEGEIDRTRTGNYRDLDGFRIPPVKITGYLQHQTTPDWSNRLQLLYSGGRDPQGNGYGLEVVKSFLTVDYLSSLKLGTGTLTIGVENLFNQRYFPIVSQIQGINSSYAAAQGTTLSVKYGFTW